MLTGELTTKSAPHWESKGSAGGFFATKETQWLETLANVNNSLSKSSPRSLHQIPFTDKYGKPLNQESFGTLNFFKNQMRPTLDLQSRPGPVFFPELNSATKDNMRVPSLSRPHFRIKQEVYRSHEKIPQKMRAPREILKEAVLKPITVDQSHLTEKVKIIHNLYNKQDRYFYCSRIDIRSIVRAIYYQGQTVDSLDEFKIPAFKSFAKQSDYFDIVWEEGTSFVEAVNKALKSKIARLLNRRNDTQSHSQNSNYPFIHFLKAPNKYRTVVDQLFNIFKHVEHVSIEIEKLNTSYIRFCREKKTFELPGFKLYMQLMATIYRDPSVTKFVEQQMRTFQKLSVYESKYPDVVEKIYEIHQISKKRLEESEAAEAQRIAGDKLAAEERRDNRTSTMSVGTWSETVEETRKRQQVYGRETAKVVSENRDQGSQIFCSQVEEESQTQDAKSKTTGKKKRKRKNKKKEETELPTEAATQPAAEVAPKSDSTAFLLEMKQFDERLKEIAVRYQIGSAKRIKIEFSACELTELQNMMKGGD